MKEEKLKILVVDDDDIDREKVLRCLQASDLEFELDNTSNADEAKKALDHKMYDCAIIDYRLGAISGIDLLESLDSRIVRQCAIIMVTGLGDEEVAAEAMRLGASDYIIKSRITPARLVQSLLDAIHRKTISKKIHDLAHYDELTGLVSRYLLLDRIQQAVAHVKRNDSLSVLAFLDLDNFKPINDNFGHDIGDFTLVEISSRLKATLRATDTISRVGGDEFVLLLTNLPNLDECKKLLHRVLSSVCSPIELPDSKSACISASVGVTIITEMDNDCDEQSIIERADKAMYAAKGSGKNKFSFFEESAAEKSRATCFTSMVEGINQNSFVLHYQPKVNIVSGELIGVEALIRWNHPEQGLLYPAQFNDALLDPFIGFSIGNWVIETALKQYQVWKAQKLQINISVNVSPGQLHTQNFLEILDSLLFKYNYEREPNFLEFEILESTSINDVILTADVLEECQKRGIKISLDDFGTGYSSLVHLKKLPLNTIKIDREFVENIDVDEDNLAIVKSIIALGESFNCNLIAEGVETPKQMQKLLSLGCSCVQGYLVSKPIPSDEIIPWLNGSSFFSRHPFSPKEQIYSST